MPENIVGFREQYRFLSNFYLCRVQVDGMFYPSAEHAYQAMKCEKKSDRNMFLYGTPSDAKKLGRRVSIRADWDKVKVDIMGRVVRAKFKQNPTLMRYLVATRPAILVEDNWWGDTFWGICKGNGQNWLGRILMEVRDSED